MGGFGAGPAGMLPRAVKRKPLRLCCLTAVGRQGLGGAPLRHTLSPVSQWESRCALPAEPFEGSRRRLRDRDGREAALSAAAHLHSPPRRAESPRETLQARRVGGVGLEGEGADGRVACEALAEECGEEAQPQVLAAIT